MAFRIHEEVERGEIDNTTRGVVRGQVWVAGRDEPLELSLRGNCHRDIAGCRLTFRNPDPKPFEELVQRLCTEQRGSVGDMTASRKVRIPDASFEEGAPGGEEKATSEHWGNAIYLEWYSELNGRVVIETTEYEVRVSEPGWTLTEEEDAEIDADSIDTFSHWLDSVEAEADTRVGDLVVPEDRPMDEFEWEQFMRESDARAERFREVLEKYADDPKRDRRIAEHMGWTWIEDALDDADADSVDDAIAKAKSEHDGDGEGAWEDWDDLPDPEPDPETEGRDWIRDDNGDVCHPLYKQGSDLSYRIFDAAKAAGLLEDEGDPDVREMVFQMQCASAKLAGALNSLAYGVGHDPGFVIAYLKRALPMVNGALNAHQRVQAKGLLSDRIGEFRDGLFGVRSGIVDLIADFRRRQLQ